MVQTGLRVLFELYFCYKQFHSPGDENKSDLRGIVQTNYYLAMVILGLKNFVAV